MIEIKLYKETNLLEFNDDLLNSDGVIIDLKNIAFLKPFHMVYIGCIYEMALHCNVEVNLISIGEKLEDYLDEIRFYDYWKENFDRTKFTSGTIHTNLCLLHISPSMIESYSRRSAEYYKNNFLNEKDLEPVAIFLKETFNNIFNHSESSIYGYTISQFYPKINMLEIAVCDFGKGIAVSIKEWLRSQQEIIMSDSEAISYATKAGVSAKSVPNNVGLGLNTIKKIVQSCNGILIIRANKGLVKISPSGIEEQECLKEFHGSLLQISLDTTKLDIYEKEEADFW